MFGIFSKFKRVLPIVPRDKLIFYYLMYIVESLRIGSLTERVTIYDALWLALCLGNTDNTHGF